MAMATASSGEENPRQRSVIRRGLRIIGEYLRAHPLPYVVAVSGATLYAAMTVASTIVLGRVTDSVLVPAFGGGVGGQTVLAGVVAIIGVAILRSAGIVIRRFFAGMTQHRNERTLRLRVIEKYARLPLAYHQSRPAGELLAHTQADIDAATAAIGPFPYATAVVSLVVFAAIAMILADPFLALIGITTLPTLALLNHVYTKRV